MIGTVPTSSGKMERRKEDRGKKVNKAAILKSMDVCKLERESVCVVCMCVCVVCLLLMLAICQPVSCKMSKRR